jgi:RimJ/RimL family protein N-acetyltransferase
MAWLPDDFVHPTRVALPTGHHLRPIRASDVDLDFPAVMGSRDRLWAKYGESWGWPPSTMTYEQDRDDLDHHEQEIEAHETFNYAVFDAEETELLGCVYLDPPESSSPPGTDVVTSWWVVDRHAGGALEAALDAFVPAWLAATWGFRSILIDP